MQKSASRRRFIRFTVRARQKDGLPRGDHRPPDGSRISLEGVRGQGATVRSWLNGNGWGHDRLPVGTLVCYRSGWPHSEYPCCGEIT